MEGGWGVEGGRLYTVRVLEAEKNCTFSCLSLFRPSLQGREKSGWEFFFSETGTGTGI